MASAKSVAGIVDEMQVIRAIATASQNVAGTWKGRAGATTRLHGDWNASAVKLNLAPRTSRHKLTAPVRRVRRRG